MAEQVAGFPTKDGYPWPDWTNGKSWRVTKGIDYQTDPKSFQAYLHKVAARKGCTVRTIRSGDEITFVFEHEGI